ncbi:MAG: hypothetical protein AB7D36_08780 [Oscillospiraceae bacterium]
MIYTKTKLKNGKIARNNVTERNTFTRCTKCEKEIQVSLKDPVLTQIDNPFNPEMLCAECTIKMMHKRIVDMDAIIRLSEALQRIGYRMEFHGVCEDFEIEDVRELAPEEYEIFADALLDKISEVRNVK